MDSFKEVFDAVKLYCKDRMVLPAYNLYIDKLEPVLFENSSRVVLSTNNTLVQEAVTNRYMNLLHEAFEAILAFDVEIEVVIPDKTPAAEPQEEEGPVLQAGTYALTFENFIKGSSNQFAFAAAQAVAANPSGAYNPLFIYGNSGLGKTHLLNAIKLEIAKNHPDYNIVMVDCATFTDGLVEAIKMNTTEQFRQQYRQADLLLIDDIQFIAGKTGTQEEFFYTFNSLHNAGKQIVLASDRPAKEIQSLADRLRSRFEMGLSADIQPPDYETRVAIIKRKAELLNLDLPDDVVDYIANNLKNNIRQLEGAVKKLNAYYMLEGISPVIGMAQAAIKDILSENQPLPVTVEKIISEVARTYNVSASDIRGPKRSSQVASARHAACYVIREITKMSLDDVGKELGGRDHSTMVHSYNKIDKDIQQDSHLKATIQDIIKNIQA